MKLLAILAFAAAAIAQQAPSTLPKIKFTDTKLDNGLRVIVSEDHYRSEEHTSELQSPCNLVCRLLLEKKHTGPDGKTCVGNVAAPSTSRPSGPAPRPATRAPSEGGQQDSPTQRATVAPLFFFNDTATTEIYTLSLHDALSI